LREIERIGYIDNERGRERGGPCSELRFPGREGGRGEGATLSPKIFNIFFCDISLLIEQSNRQVSHFPYKDITRVISKGRDRIVEIGSNRLLSLCKLLI